MYRSERVKQPRADARSPDAAPPAGLLVAIAVYLFIDGLVLGAGFAAASRTRLLLTVALALELVFLGLSTAAALAPPESPRCARSPDALGSGSC